MTRDVVELPLFPLNTVLFPGGLLPLKVFEQRYVEMTKRCVQDDTPFGVCLIREGLEVGEPAMPATIGCTARIAQWEVPYPNLFHLIAAGEDRFRILHTEVAALGLLTCRAELIPGQAATSTPDPVCRKLLTSLVERLGAQRFPSPLNFDDAAWVGFRLAEVLPLGMDVRQQLLETDSPEVRLELLRRVLGEAGIA